MHAYNTFVIIETNEGILGYGEGSPDKEITGDDQEETLTFLKHASNELVGSEIDLEEIHKKLVNLERKLDFQSQTSKCTIDMAVYDIIGKEEGPIYKILGAQFIRMEYPLQ